MHVSRAHFGRMPDGQPVDRITLEAPDGVSLSAITYGATITALTVPDRDGRPGDVVLGHDTLDGYLHASPYFGAVVGRYAGRIAHARFTLDGREHRLAANDGPHTLHGGRRGFDKVLWTAEAARTDTEARVTFTYRSPDGEEGFPGTLDVRVTYTLDTAGRIGIAYEAVTDRATPVNLTQHTYFNLAGAGDILGHELTIPATRFVPVDATIIPTGALRPVAGTPFDFTAAHAVGARIDAADPQLRAAGGYDHAWALEAPGDERAIAARVRDPGSGRTLEVRTTAPALQFYAGNFLDGSITGKRGQRYGRRAGLCLETQQFADGPNQPAFPSCILRPGERWRSRTWWTFATDRTGPR
ncbi:MAG: galactose mutarotase [Gemmatimonadaceae bacterium]|nr:galactose mutarotase [Gemmatimonadaceae bacterium]